jgi:hypothetical protein
MSLKSFHVIFIGAAFLLALFFAGWSANQYFTRSHQIIDLVGALVAVSGAVALIIYGRYFRRKLKNIDYL